jgi:uncharacterized RDD family membrane protein YckC
MSYGGYQQQPPGYGAPPPPGGYGYGGAAYAGPGKRIVAYIIDGIIVGLGSIPGIILIFLGVGMAASTASPSGQLSDEAAAGMLGTWFLGWIVAALGGLAVWLFNCHLLGRDGATLGKKMMKVKVLDPQGQPLGFGKAFLREIVKYALGSVCFILLLWPLWDNEKQGLQDKLFSTHVYDA